MSSRLGSRAQGVLFSYAALLPALALFALIQVFPVIQGFWISLHSWDGLSPMSWRGIDNYRFAIEDEVFLQAMGNTVLFAVVVTVMKNVLGLLIALLLNAKIQGRGLFRTSIFTPVTLSFVVIGILWTWIFNPTFGLLNEILRVIGLGGLIQGWLSDPSIALWSVMWVDIWKWTGFHVVIFLAGLQQVPKDLLDAAEIDGASSRQRLFYITIPLLRPVIVASILLSVIGAFTATYDLVFVMTGGGPFHATEVALTWITTTTLRFASVGEGNAMSIILFLVVGVIAVVMLVALRRGQDETVA